MSIFGVSLMISTWVFGPLILVKGFKQDLTIGLLLVYIIIGILFGLVPAVAAIACFVLILIGSIVGLAFVIDDPESFIYKKVLKAKK